MASIKDLVSLLHYQSELHAVLHHLFKKGTGQQCIASLGTLILPCCNRNSLTTTIEAIPQPNVTDPL